MKTLLKTNVILLLGIVALWGCEEDVTPLQHTAPQVTFPVQETSLTAVVGDPVEFRADIESGDKLTCGWYVDGTLEASTAEMTYTFSAPGDYEVRFEARNGAGKVEKSYAVKVADVLKMHLSVGDSTRIVRRQLDVLKVMAVVDAGSDVVHEWKVDGKGPYTIAYHAVNSKQETVDRTWTVTMVPSGALFEHFEDYTELPKWWTLKQNDPGIQLADNPKPEGINTSAKVLSDKVNGTGGTSGYFDLKLKDIPADKIDVTKYTGIRFKIYLGKNKYYPRVQYNDTRHQPVTKPQFRDEWEVLEYRFGANLDPTKTITFRPMLKEDGSNIASGAVTETNTRTVYIDDIEFLE